MKTMLVVGTAAALLWGCGAPEKKETIKIGTVLSTTGALSHIGGEQLDAVGLAVLQINASGGVLGKELEIVARDDGTDVERGREAATALVEAGVPVVIGATGSAITLAASEVLAAAGVVQFSASSTSPQLTTAADDNFLFRTCPSDALQGKLVARRAKEKGHTRVAVIHIPGAYGTGLASQFKASFEGAGGVVTGVHEYTEEQPSYSALLTEVMANDPQAIVLVAYPIDASQVIKDYLAGFAASGVSWFFTDALQDAGFVTAVGASNFTFEHEGTGASAPKGAGYEKYSVDFAAAFGAEPALGTFSPNAYDAVFLAALAMEAAGSADAVAIRDALAAVSAGGAPFGPGEFADAAKAARAGEDINFEGVSGNVDLDGAGDTVAPYDIWKVSNGTVVIAESGLNP